MRTMKSESSAKVCKLTLARLESRKTSAMPEMPEDVVPVIIAESCKKTGHIRENELFEHTTALFLHAAAQQIYGTQSNYSYLRQK